MRARREECWGCEGLSCLASPLPPLHPQLSPAAWPRASSRLSRSRGVVAARPVVEPSYSD